MFGKIVRLFYRSPDVQIGGATRPYLLRWHVIPRNRWFNVYLHKFLRDDDDRALHDHPWPFLSIMLRGMYTEIVAHDLDGNGRGFVRSAPGIAYRPAEHRHRVVLERRNGRVVPCWTLVITGSKQRVWGFWCERGWVPWYQFVSPKDHGEIGRGCE